MKAVIAEIQGKHAAALLEDGRFVKIPNRQYVVGQRVVLTPGKRQRAMQQWMKIAAMLVLVVGLSTMGSVLYLQPVASVSLDINPAITVSFNRFFRVLSVGGVNDDGTSAIETLHLADLKNAYAADAVQDLLTQLHAQYAAQGEETYILLATSGQSASQEEALYAMVETAAVAVSETEGDLTVLSYHADQETVAQAQTLGVTPGKLSLVRDMGETASADEAYWLAQPIQAIVEETGMLAAEPEEEVPEEAEQTPAPTPSPAPTETPTPMPTPSPTASPTPTPMVIPVGVSEAVAAGGIASMIAQAPTPTPAPTVARTPSSTAEPQGTTSPDAPISVPEGEQPMLPDLSGQEKPAQPPALPMEEREPPREGIPEGSMPQGERPQTHREPM